MNTARLVALCIAVSASPPTALAGPSGYHVIDRIGGPDGGWDYASFDAGRDRVLVARSTAVNAFDLKSRTVTEAFAPAAWGHAAFPINGGTEVLITNGAKAMVTFVDAKTGSPLATLPTGLAPDDAIIDPKSGLLLVMNHVGGDITLIPVGGRLEAAAVDGQGRAFVNVEDRNEIAVVDIAARQVTARYPLAGCDGPTGIAYAPADRLLISSCEGLAEVVDADSGKVVRQVRIGDGADGVAFDTRRKLAFVSAGKSGTLSVISVARGDARLVDTVPTQKGARTLTLDPASGRVFLPTAQYVAGVGGGRPTVAPGTFELLIVGR
jgi:DNA-binding beta-propeller fold protein YncE